MSELNGSDTRQGHVGADQVSTKVEVDLYEGQVLLRHDKLCRVSMFDPQTAMDFATGIARAAYCARTGTPYTDGVLVSLKDEVIDRKRLILQNRCGRIITQMLSEGASNQAVINEILDLVLKEIT